MPPQPRTTTAAAEVDCRKPPAPGSHVPVPPVPAGVAVLLSGPLPVMASTSAASRLPQPGCLGRV